MFFEMTVQVRVTNIDEGHKWYQTLLKKELNFSPNDTFLEWEIIPGCWLQVAEGTPTVGSGPLRLGITNIEEERDRVMNDLKVEYFDIHSIEGVPVKWGTFSDPWGNRIGFFEYINKAEETERIKTILGN